MTARRFYALCAPVGAVVPYLFFVSWVRGNGLDWGRFFALPFASGPAALFSADLLVAASVFLVFAILEGRRARVRPLWAAPLAVVAFGLCCALPLFLWLREQAMERAA